MASEPSTSATRNLGRSSDATKDTILCSRDCMFCNTVSHKHIRMEGVRTTEDTTTFDYDDANIIKRIAEKRDIKLLTRIIGQDLFAVEAQYHPSCKKAYTQDPFAWQSKDA